MHNILSSLHNRFWPIALDIGSDSIKMLQLERVGGELTVCACGRYRFPAESHSDPARRRELTISAVRDLTREQRFKGRRVVTAIPFGQLSLKNVRMPVLPPHEIAEAVKWEACERFNFEIDLDRLKYLRAGEIRQGAETQDEIIMLAVTEEAINSHLEMLDAMNLRPEHIDAEPVALFRSFERFLRREGDKNVVRVALDIGTEISRIVVARGRQIVFIKGIDIGGRHLTDAVARQLNLTLEEAGELRTMIMKEHAEGTPHKPDNLDDESQQVSESVSWTVHDAVRGELETLAKEVSLCLRYCSVTFRGLRPRCVTITGGQAYDPSVIKLLSEQLGITCVIGRPLQGIDVSRVTFGGNRRGMMAEWAVSVGLALRDVGADETIPETDNGPNRLSA